MEASFWLKAWEEGRTGFHQQNYNELMMKDFPEVNSGRVLVPLCGKTKDMIWLRDQGLEVFGYELFRGAVEDFFSENSLGIPDIKKSTHFETFKVEGIEVMCGDIFNMSESTSFDYIYDRASLVALPPQMRKSYAKLMTKVLRKDGEYLLIVFEYDQSQMSGPPFSISEQEIYSLYNEAFKIEKKSQESIKRDNMTGEFTVKTYLLKKS